MRLAMVFFCVLSAAAAQACVVNVQPEMETTQMMETKTSASRMPLLMPDDFTDLHLCGWRIEPGKLDPNNPLIEGDQPWDAGGVGIHGTVLKDPIDGLYKAWLVTTPPEETDAGWPNGWASVANDRDRSICYFESKDGVNWTKPKIPGQKYGNQNDTNVIFDSHVFGLQAYASVLIDPKNKEWPYEMFVLQTPTEIAKPAHGSGYHRYRSKDGKKWEWVSGPISGCIWGDVLFVYKDNAGGYIGYYRTGDEKRPDDHVPVWEDSARRTCYRCVSKDGNFWVKDDVMVIQRDERHHRDTQFMECVQQKVDGGFIAMVSVYHPITQTLDIWTAASRDGQRWWFPDRLASLPNAPMGDYGGGMLWQTKNLIIEGNTLYLYHAGSEGPHRQMSDTRAPSVQVNYQESIIDHGAHFSPFTTALCRATWDFDRLYALISSPGGPTIGSAVTKPAQIGGKSLRLNVVTRPPKKSDKPNYDEGYLQVELLDAQGAAISGFTRNDCAPIKGDHRSAQVKWTGGTAAPKNAAKAKFYLKRAFLYGFKFE